MTEAASATERENQKDGDRVVPTVSEVAQVVEAVGEALPGRVAAAGPVASTFSVVGDAGADRRDDLVGDLGHPVRRRCMLGGRGQRRDPQLGITDDGQRKVLHRVMSSDIHADEGRVLREGRPRPGREILKPGSDGDHHVAIGQHPRQLDREPQAGVGTRRARAWVQVTALSCLTAIVRNASRVRIGRQCRTSGPVPADDRPATDAVAFVRGTRIHF